MQRQRHMDAGTSLSMQSVFTSFIYLLGIGLSVIIKVTNFICLLGIGLSVIVKIMKNKPPKYAKYKCELDHASD